MRGIVFLETDGGFVIQGTSVTGTTGSGESMGRSDRETLQLQDEDIGGFMDDALARRGRAPDATPKHYESQLRVIGRYLDGLHPRDIFFFELDGAYVIRITQSGQGGLKQELIEFTQGDIADLIAGGPGLRRTDAKAKPA